MTDRLSHALHHPPAQTSEKEKNRRNGYCKRRREDDPAFRFVVTARCRLRSMMLVGSEKGQKRSRALIGCTPAELRRHIESLWKAGMSWENYGHGGWVIDHVKPCCDFDLLWLSEQKACFHFTNLQPLWEHENIAKGSSW
jgi:hypothetical protein